MLECPLYLWSNHIFTIDCFLYLNYVQLSFPLLQTGVPIHWQQDSPGEGRTAHWMVEVGTQGTIEM